MPRSIIALGCTPRRLLLAGLVGAGWLTAGPAALAQLPDVQPPKNVPGVNDQPDLPNGPDAPASPAPDATANWPRMTLGECLAVALERQPTLKAAQQSLASSMIGRQALDNLPRIAGRLQPDLPCRKQQAARGVTLTTAALQQARQETVYDVTRLYYTYVYARQQETTARDLVEQMEVYYRVAEDILKSGVRDPKIKTTQFTLYTLRDVIHEVQRGQARATTGKQAALAALREAMGVDECFQQFVPADAELPVMSGSATQDQVVCLALSRRPELVQAAAGVDAFRLEVAAQAKQDGLFAFQSPTLASGSDLHARQVPMAHRNGDYRPGAIAPEMPPNLVGRVEDRVARATALAVRQEAVYEKAVGLIRLEATNAFLNFEATARAMNVAKGRFETGRKLVEQARQAAGLQQDAELLVRNEALAGKAQSEYVEAVFEHLKALATLERVTAGAITPAFPGR